MLDVGIVDNQGPARLKLLRETVYTHLRANAKWHMSILAIQPDSTVLNHIQLIVLDIESNINVSNQNQWAGGTNAGSEHRVLQRSSLTKKKVIPFAIISQGAVEN